MRILIITGIFPPDIGGPATYVPQMASGLTTRGHEITVVTLSAQVDYSDDTYPFRVVRLPRHLRKPWRWLCTMRRLVRLGRWADVLFVNGLAMETALANLWLRKPVVQKIVGDLAWERATHWGWVQDSFEDFHKSHYGLRVEVLKALRTWWIRTADTVIVPSRYLAHWVAQWGVAAERIVVVYNALAPVDDIQPLEVPLQTPIKVVTVGRLVPWKRVDKVMEAMVHYQDVGLVVVGDGPERERLEELAGALGMAERVYLAGQRSQVETLRLMAACDLFVLNSTYEGFPHVVLESMSVGLPVVATAVGGTSEVVRDRENGRLIAPMDDEALSTVFLQLVSSPLERQRLASRAKQTVAQFDLQHLVVETERLLWKCAHMQGAV
jgi:glycosyltransferase involved in cell wall biosynthesis